MLFLKQLSEHSNVTKMTVDNLALVFSPNLIRDASNGLQEMLMSGHISSVTSFLIGHAYNLFGAASGPAAPPTAPPSLSTPTLTTTPAPTAPNTLNVPTPVSLSSSGVYTHSHTSSHFLHLFFFLHTGN